MQNQNFAHRLCLTAAAAALTFLMTVIPKIPIPLGYAHLGDAVIFLLPFFLRRRDAALAAAVGSALADLMGGFPIWILPTLLIKYGMVCIAAPFAGHYFLRAAAGFALSSLWMAAGYTLFGAIFYDSLETGLLQLPGLLAEGAVNTAVALILLIVFNKTEFLK